ncbi:hypothetical protein [Eisenbergiella sp.]
MTMAMLNLIFMRPQRSAWKWQELQVRLKAIKYLYSKKKTGILPEYSAAYLQDSIIVTGL